MFYDFGESNGNIRPTKKNKKSYDFQKDVKFVMQSGDFGETTLADTQDMFGTLDVSHIRPVSSVAGACRNKLLTVDVKSRWVAD